MFEQDAEGSSIVTVSCYSHLKSLSNGWIKLLLKNTIKQHKYTLGLPDGMKLKEFGDYGVTLKYAVCSIQEGRIAILVERSDTVYVYKRVSARWSHMPLYATIDTPIWYDTLTVCSDILTKGDKVSYFKTVTVGGNGKDIVAICPKDIPKYTHSVCYCVEDFLSKSMCPEEVFRHASVMGNDDCLFVAHDLKSTLYDKKGRQGALDAISRWEASCL